MARRRKLKQTKAAKAARRRYRTKKRSAVARRHPAIRRMRARAYINRLGRKIRKRAMKRYAQIHVGDKVKDADMGSHFAAYVESVGPNNIIVKDSSGMRIRYNKRQAKHLKKAH